MQYYGVTLGGSVIAGIRARLYTRDLNTPLITCFWNKTWKIKVCLQNALGTLRIN
jgi:hypothetical protein